MHFTSDERFLLTVGKDKKLIVWDMLSGCIVSRSPKLKNIPLRLGRACARHQGARDDQIPVRDGRRWQLDLLDARPVGRLDDARGVHIGQSGTRACRHSLRAPPPHE